MKVNVSKELLNHKGEASINDEAGKPATIATVCIKALDTVLQSDANDKPSDVKKRWALLDRICAAEKNGGVLDMDAGESATLQERVVKLGFPTTVAARVCLALDGEPDANAAS